MAADHGRESDSLKIGHLRLRLRRSAKWARFINALARMAVSKDL
jgi:hypothetical protein